MKITIIPQAPISGIKPVRVGDILIDIIKDPRCKEFIFAVAFMRMSGLGRLRIALDDLVSRGGTISGAVGIDSKVTTEEALLELLSLSSTSTIFYTVSGFIYHPKVYLALGDTMATAVFGSANLTMDGLFRNIEFGAAIELDLTDPDDQSLCSQLEGFIRGLLDSTQPNVQAITNQLVTVLTRKPLIGDPVVGSEKNTWEPGTQISKPVAKTTNPLSPLFPEIRVPVAPPSFKKKLTPVALTTHTVTTTSIVPPLSTFIMQLSSHDCAHRTGVKGTAGVLVPKDALRFFPPIAAGPRKFKDIYFDAILNTPTGKTVHNYRLWYYDVGSTGKRIDEHRLDVGHETIDLTTAGGGDLLVISRMPLGVNPEYEVTILSSSDPQYGKFLSLCAKSTNGKIWGLI